jgi:hypothetical protein
LTYVRFNSGNQATCTLQGFIIQLGYVASPLFNVTMALFFLLRIRYRWTDSRLRRMEPWIQASIWIFALGCAIYPIPLGMYNNAWEICWIESYPMDCQDSHRYGTEANSNPCTRGDNAWIHALSFQVFPPWICVFCALIFMGMIYATVRRVEERNTRYGGSHVYRHAAAAAAAFSSSAEASGQSQSQHQRQQQQQQQDNSASCKSSKTSRFSSILSSLSRSYAAAASHASTNSTPTNTASAVVVEAPNNRCSSPKPGGGEETIINTPQRRQRRVVNHQRSDKVATQAMWYITAFFATYLLDFIASICWYVFDLWWFWLDIIAYFLLPLQGFFNFCVFCRSRKMKSRAGKLARKIVCCLEGKVSITKRVLRFCHSCCCRDENGNNNVTTVSRRGGGGGRGDKNSSSPCPTALPPPPSCNINDRTDHDPTTKTVKVSFASPPTIEKSASAASSSSSLSCSPPLPPPPPNPCGNNDIIITDEHYALSLPQTVMPSTDLTRLGLNDQSQGSKTEAERYFL